MGLEKEPSERKIRTGIAMQLHKGIISKTTFMEEKKKKKQEHFENTAVRSFTCTGFSEGMVFPAFWPLARAQKDQSKMLC